MKAVIVEARDFCTLLTAHLVASIDEIILNRLRRNWSVNNALPSRIVRIRLPSDAGRNGGHLTARVFESFQSLQNAYGTTEALKSIAVENYTVESIFKIVKDHNLTDTVDLEELGRIELLVTEPEIVDAKANLDAARKAGADLSKTEWINADEMNEVRALGPSKLLISS